MKGAAMRHGLLVLALSACLPASGDDTGLSAVEQQEADIAAYEALQDELLATLSEVADLGHDGVQMQASDGRLFWARYHDWDPDLYNLDVATGTITDCGAIAGGGDTPNFRVGDQRSAQAVDKKVELFDTDSCELVATVDFGTVPAGLGWWAYAVDGLDLYAVVESTGAHMVRRWRSGSITDLGTLEQAGYEVDEFWDFGVAGDTLLYIESGRLFELDLNSWTSTWVQTETQVSAVSWDDAHVLATSADALLLWDRTSHSSRNVGEELAALPDLNGTYADSEDYRGGNATLADGVVYYESGRGIFAYDTAARTAEPVVLEERDLSLEFYDPMVAGDAVFVRSYGDFDTVIWRVD